MTDYTELKRLAEAAKNDCGDYVALNDYGMAVPPAAVLALIADVERLQRAEKNDLIAYKAVLERQHEIRDERDQLKHDVDVLRHVVKMVEAERDALKDENEQLKTSTGSTMGVGSGSGKLFVRGDYDSIKAAQAIVLERDQLKAENEALTRLEAGLREMLHRQNKEINRLKKAARNG